jgi:putative endonuclease
MFYTYILKSEKNGSYYVGSCKDTSKRLSFHNNGLVKSTKRYAPWCMIYNEEYEILSEARKRELQIKSWKKRSAIEKLLQLKLEQL